MRTRKPVASENLLRRSQEIIDRASASFSAASRLFPTDIRHDVTLLYTWCRHCDDMTDGQELGRGKISTASSDTLTKLRADSLAALAGQPSNELPFQALANLSRRHTISRALVEAHLRGFELDVQGWQPETLDDTMKYCYHTAGTVGVMMATIMNVSDGLTLQRASDLGIAFQLTNIARDVREDAMAGRSYLPRQWREASNLDIPALACDGNATRVFPLVKRLVVEAEAYYDSAAVGIRALPRRAAWAIAAARATYRDIGRQIVRRGPNAIAERTFTTQTRKAMLTVSALPDVLARRNKPSANRTRTGLWTPPEIA